MSVDGLYEAEFTMAFGAQGSREEIKDGCQSTGRIMVNIVVFLSRSRNGKSVAVDTSTWQSYTKPFDEVLRFHPSSGRLVALYGKDSPETLALSFQLLV